MRKIIAVIPARYKSSRFPGKPIVDICGKPMIWWVFQNVKKVKYFTDIMIATDDERIAKKCNEFDMSYMMTSSKHPTGTDRIAEVAEKIDADYYVNIQGDEPLLSHKIIEKALQPIFDNERFDAINCMCEITDSSDIINSTVPKVVVNAKNKAIFLSRSPIPHPKKRRSIFFKQVCVYVFANSALKKFSELPQGPIECVEDIEILRFIENHMVVRMVEVSDTIIVWKESLWHGPSLPLSCLWVDIP